MTWQARAIVSVYDCVLDHRRLGFIHHLSFLLSPRNRATESQPSSWSRLVSHDSIHTFIHGYFNKFPTDICPSSSCKPLENLDSSSTSKCLKRYAVVVVFSQEQLSILRFKQFTYSPVLGPNNRFLYYN